VFLLPGAQSFTITRHDGTVWFRNHAWKHDAVEPAEVYQFPTKWTWSDGAGGGARAAARAHGIVAGEFASIRLRPASQERI